MLLYIDGGVRGHHLKREKRVGCIAIAGEIEHVSKVEAETNSQAEYMALIRAMELAIEKGERKLEVMSDSEFLVKQVKGEYRVKSKELKVLFKRVRDLSASFDSFSPVWIPRERNVAGKILEKAHGVRQGYNS